MWRHFKVHLKILCLTVLDEYVSGVVSVNQHWVVAEGKSLKSEEFSWFLWSNQSCLFKHLQTEMSACYLSLQLLNSFTTFFFYIKELTKLIKKKIKRCISVTVWWLELKGSPLYPGSSRTDFIYKFHSSFLLLLVVIIL